jgi:hypothetical protein
MTKTGISRAARERQAAKSGGRAAGYCWLEHPDGSGRCTREPDHPGSTHIDYYTGRTSPTSTTGVEWTE